MHQVWFILPVQQGPRASCSSEHNRFQYILRFNGFMVFTVFIDLATISVKFPEFLSHSQAHNLSTTASSRSGSAVYKPLYLSCAHLPTFYTK